MAVARHIYFFYIRIKIFRFTQRKWVAVMTYTHSVLHLVYLNTLLFKKTFFFSSSVASVVQLQDRCSPVYILGTTTKPCRPSECLLNRPGQTCSPAGTLSSGTAALSGGSPGRGGESRDDVNTGPSPL